MLSPTRKSLNASRTKFWSKLSGQLAVYRSQITRCPVFINRANRKWITRADHTRDFLRVFLRDSRQLDRASGTNASNREYGIAHTSSALPRSYETRTHTCTCARIHKSIRWLGNATLQRVLSTVERKIEALADDDDNDDGGGVSRSRPWHSVKSLGRKKSPVHFAPEGQERRERSKERLLQWGKTGATPTWPVERVAVMPEIAQQSQRHYAAPALLGIAGWRKVYFCWFKSRQRDTAMDGDESRLPDNSRPRCFQAFCGDRENLESVENIRVNVLVSNSWLPENYTSQ